MTQPAFERLRSQPIASLNVTVEEYRHVSTGAQHIHIAADNSENAFLVALRTVPHDSTGVAHILEHTALCGSRRYPVRDPFFMMIRRSLNTFMNAFTSSDWTAYPFASVNRKDFANLLDVYLDAVFFPILDPLDFAQEGHRLEFAKVDDPSTPLEFKGVVYNEMKGAMSAENSILWHTLCKYLHPTTTYHYNSGGDPESIPDLDYDELVAFHRTHYHPSNAIFMTFGDIPAREHQAEFERRVLSGFEPLQGLIEVPAEKRYLAPLRIEEAYGVDAEEGIAERTHVVIGWLLNDSTDLYSTMKSHLLSAVLLDNSASPLLKALETTDLGRSPSPLCGLEDSQRELAFVCGLEGTETERADAIESLVLETLREVVEHGVPQEQIEACLHQLELQQREITGDGFPYGLHLMLTALNGATHRGDAIALLDLDPVIARLREDIRDRDFIPSLCRELLLDNPHRVRLTLRPDTELDARRDLSERARLDQIAAQLDDSRRQEIVQLGLALQQRQQQEDDPELLPRVTLDDVPAEMRYVERESVIAEPSPLTRYAAGTNGLLYQQIVCELPTLDDDELDLLPLLCQLLTEVGVDDLDYLAVQQWQAATCGSIRAGFSVRGAPADLNETRGFFTLSAKSLASDRAELSRLMDRTLAGARFDESRRVREIISQLRRRAQSSITGSGHTLAMSAASQHFSPTALLQHRSSGLSGIASLIRLDEKLDLDAAIKTLLSRLGNLHAKLLGMSRQYLVVAEEAELKAATLALREQSGTDGHQSSFSPLRLPRIEPTPADELWTTRSQVNFCARAYPTVALDHPDAAALTVLGGYLRNNYLHRAIREQGGAYGGGAAQDSHGGAFRFYSYRDPRLQETLADFDAAIRWAIQTAPDPRLVEESVLGVIASLDKPGSPAGEAKQTFQAELHGRTREVRERFRNRVLAVAGEDLQRVASEWLRPERASTAVIADSSRAALAAELSLSIKPIQHSE